MKILRLLNKKNFIFFLFFAFLNNSIANEPVDIWNIDKTKNVSENSNQNDVIVSEEISQEDTSVFDLNNKNVKNNENEVILENDFTDKISLYGLYDPDENNLSIEMWNESDGKEIKMVVSDRKNDTSNDFSIVVGETDKKFSMNFKVENIKIVPGTYEVKISRKLLSQFKSAEYDLTYYIALEPDITWED